MKPLGRGLSLFISGLVCNVDGVGGYSSRTGSGHEAFDHLQTGLVVKPVDDYNPETPIVWVDRTTLPFSVECLIAFVWVCMVAGLPCLAIKLESHAITASQLKTYGAMWLALAGGVYLFTQVLLFQSSHFDTQRPLTMVECVYLMSQILTTVGYGDITPAKPRGQVFVALYVILSLVVIANVLSEVIGLTTSHIEKHAEQMQKLWEQAVQRQVSGKHSEEDRAKLSAGRWVRTHLQPLPWKNFLNSLLTWLLCVLIGVLFFVNYPGENRTPFQAVYMSVITLSTVGFGAFTPLTEMGKAFGAFWMLFGSAAMLGLVSSCCELIAVMKMREQLDPKQAQANDAELALQQPPRMDNYAFLRFGLLQSNATSQFDLQLFETIFKELGPDSDGTVSKDAILKYLERHGL